EPDAVLVLHPVDDGHEAVLYFRPASGRDTEEFFADARYGEFWVGARPTLRDLAETTGLATARLDELIEALAKDVGPDGVRVRVVPGADQAVTEAVEKVRTDAASDRTRAERAADDAALAEALSELRLVKDSWEIDRLREAVAATIDGF